MSSLLPYAVISLIGFFTLFAVLQYQELPYKSLIYQNYIKWKESNISWHLIFPRESLEPPYNFTTEEKLMVDFTGYFSSNMQIAWIEQKHLCPEYNCTVSANKNWASKAHAVIFHGRGMTDFKSVPKIRHSWQRYVFFLLESPQHTWLNLKNGKNFFNLTMTYRKDSDIWYPYENMRKIEPPEISDYYLVENLIKTKTKLVAQFVSNCHTASKREVYVAELQKYIKIDVYGACGSFSCSRNKENDCVKLLKNDYKFYLSFENSICNDYVTEKFYKLKHFIVPIVLRAKDYQNLGIPNGSYIAADQFASPKKLADYLHFLDKNNTEYLKYFQWRKSWTIGPSKSQKMCKLCQMLHENSLPVKSYADLNDWWYTRGDCKPNFAKELALKK